MKPGVAPTQVMTVRVRARVKSTLCCINSLNLILLAAVFVMQADSNRSSDLPNLQSMRFNRLCCRCCGVLEVARIARAGFPTRYCHRLFVDRYKVLLSPSVQQQVRFVQAVFLVQNCVVVFGGTCQLLPCTGSINMTLIVMKMFYLIKLRSRLIGESAVALSQQLLHYGC